MAKNDNEMLTVGDTVIWRGGWGQDPAQLATVDSIEIDCNPKYGTRVQSCPWWQAKRNTTVVTFSDNHHWAYGYQIERFTATEVA